MLLGKHLAIYVIVNLVFVFTGQCALHYAASKDHYEIAELLLGNGAATTVGDWVNNTPLHRATSKGNPATSAAPRVNFEIENLLLHPLRIRVSKWY